MLCETQKLLDARASCQIHWAEEKITGIAWMDLQMLIRIARAW
jgi:hypothetical protein